MADKIKINSEKKQKSQAATLKEVICRLGRYRIFLVFSILLATVSVALTLYIPKLTGHAVDYVIGKGEVNFPGVIRVMIQIGVCTLITALAQWLMNVCNNKMTYQMVQDIRNEAFDKIEQLPLKYIDGHPYGEVVSRVIADVDQFSDGLLMGFTQLFTGIATIVGTFCFMLSVNVSITFVVVLITPVSFFVANFIAKRTFRMFRLQSEIRGEQTGLIDEDPQIPEPEHAVHLTDIDGNVKVEKVSFSYLPGQHLIEDFNLEVKPGQRIAIVGPTGCGKTTLINLLMRFYDVNAGSIKVEDIDIREMTRKSLRAGYGMVLQETWLKTGTIRENIAMGRPDATEEEIVEAAKASHIHNYIRRLPKGYDTWITEDGGGLSQGQKQLLCIARVMLCRPPMLILDEATSSIDTRTEIKIQQAFAKLMEGRTTFIVAHRLSTIREADVILVMKDGKIIEQGNHEVLMKKEGFYHHLYESQFSM